MVECSLAGGRGSEVKEIKGKEKTKNNKEDPAD
jgi:hypothetical protein